MKTQNETKITQYNPNLDNTEQDFSPATDKFGVLNHKLRLSISNNSSMQFKNVYLDGIMTDIEAAQLEHAALVAVAEVAELMDSNRATKEQLRAVRIALAALAAVRKGAQ